MDSKIKIGIWIENDLELNNNGAKNYFDSVYEIFKNNLSNDVIIKFISSKKVNISNVIHFNPKYVFIVHYIITLLTKFGSNSRLISFVKTKILKLYQLLISPLNREIDIIYYITPIDKVIPNIPYIYTVWDLGHLCTYPFPELSMYNSFEYRQNFYKTNLHKAFAIFTESQEGKNNLINYMNIFPDKIFVMPMIPSNIVLDEIIPNPVKYLDNTRFIHYPAHFWAHKNHFNLILAFKKVLNSFPDIKLILSGFDKGTKSYINNLIIELNIKSCIIIVERFSIEELKWVYLNSLGLVFPSFFGPTNMPIIEAYELGCKIACSNLPGHFEQVGNYANYFDPNNPEQIAQSILDLISNTEFFSSKKENKAKDKFVNEFNFAIKQIKQIRKTW